MDKYVGKMFKISSELKEYILKLHLEGKSYSQLIKITKLSKSSIARICNPETHKKDLARGKKRYWDNVNSSKKRKQDWLLKNKDWQKIYARQYLQENILYFTCKVAERRALQKTASIPLSKHKKKLIRKIYLKAKVKTKITGSEYAVDHIMPLKGKNSMGLHVPWNLQILTKSENSRKYNKEPEILPWAIRPENKHIDWFQRIRRFS